MLTTNEKPIPNLPAVLAMIALIILILAAACGRQLSPTPTPTPTPKPMNVIETRLTAAERAAIFETVWQTVNDGYFDPSFGGKDWIAIGNAYRQKLYTVQDDYTFWLKVLNPMLFELGVSHLAALPAEFANQVDPMTFATGSLGMDVRLLDGKVVVTQVVKGSPADDAGLRPGYSITSLDGWTLEYIAANNIHTPPDNESSRRGSLAQGMRALLYGETGKQVVVEYLDANDRPGSAVLYFAPRSGSACDQIDPSLPPACAEIEVRRLADGTGYLRFSGFVSSVMDSVLQAIKDFHDAPALIIDLRGNPGGQFFVRKAFASQLVGEPKLFISYQHREGLEEAYLDPVPDAYKGQVVILVDELSASSSEEFAGSLQSLGRATIVGAQTPGKCLTMNVVPLLKGAILLLPSGQSQTPDGRVLENNGVTPDIPVTLERSQLLKGIDAQLQSAINYINGK